MHTVMIAAMVQVFLVALAQDEHFKQIAPGQWLPLGVAIIGLVFAASLLAR